jgi:hypothetical protein
MRANTKDAPGESHVATAAIAKGVRLLEPRVLQECITDPQIFRSPANADRWSVWREDEFANVQCFVVGGSSRW